MEKPQQSRTYINLTQFFEAQQKMNSSLSIASGYAAVGNIQYAGVNLQEAAKHASKVVLALSHEAGVLEARRVALSFKDEVKSRIEALEKHVTGIDQLAKTVERLQSHLPSMRDPFADEDETPYHPHNDGPPMETSRDPDLYTPPVSALLSPIVSPIVSDPVPATNGAH